jgi:UDP-N-acetylmuramoyl-L-alanyl-D-glutamate--2,6-diaminopimelate ligase
MHNIYNILAAACVCLQEGLNLETIKNGIEHFTSVPGRLESVHLEQDFSIFIDFAHTQDALENVLTSLRQTSNARIILVFGCGGDRDKSKRRLMGQVASRLADFSIVTSDNPRSEDPQCIIDQIVEGFHNKNFMVVVNRKEAIEQAIKIARTGDIVLIAGKGHETSQIFADYRIEFNEREIIEKCLSC